MRFSAPSQAQFEQEILVTLCDLGIAEKEREIDCVDVTIIVLIHLQWRTDGKWPIEFEIVQADIRGGRNGFVNQTSDPFSPNFNTFPAVGRSDFLEQLAREIVDLHYSHYLLVGRF